MGYKCYNPSETHLFQTIQKGAPFISIFKFYIRIGEEGPPFMFRLDEGRVARRHVARLPLPVSMGVGWSEATYRHACVTWKKK